MPRQRGNRDAEPVYSTEGGGVDRRKDVPRRARSDAPPRDGVVRVSRSSAGRRGKTVTLITGLPPSDLDRVATALKRRCGSGGAVKRGTVELQGDHRDTVVEHLERDYRVKRAGG